MGFKTSTSSLNRRDASVLGAFLKFLRLWYYQYEVTFSPYVMTTGEKLVLNSIVVLFFSLLVMGVYTYLPNLVMRVAMRLFWLCGGLYGGVYGGGEKILVAQNTTMWNEGPLIMY
jgi:hypothetical protein